MISLKEMKYIIAIADTNSGALAANKCFVSRGAVLQSLLKVEDELNMKLFDRAKGFCPRLAVNNVGAAVIEQMRVVVAEAEKVKSLAKSF